MNGSEKFFKTWPISHFRNQVEDYCVIFDQTNGRHTARLYFNINSFLLLVFIVSFSHSCLSIYALVLFTFLSLFCSTLFFFLPFSLCMTASLLISNMFLVFLNWPIWWMWKMDHKTLILIRDFSNSKFSTMTYSTTKNTPRKLEDVWIATGILKHIRTQKLTHNCAKFNFDWKINNSLAKWHMLIAANGNRQFRNYKCTFICSSAQHGSWWHTTISAIHIHNIFQSKKNLSISKQVSRV